MGVDAGLIDRLGSDKRCEVLIGGEFTFGLGFRKAPGR